MKPHLIITTTLAVAILFTMAFIAGCASSGSRATEEQKFIQLRHVANTGAETNLKKGDAVAMVCTKCKTVIYANLQKPYSRFVTPFEHRHYCPGCKSTITTTGIGLNSKVEVRHTCNACGSESVFCCATRRDVAATEGTEKN